MKRRLKMGLKCIALACGVLLVAGIVAPFTRADRYAEQIRRGLETALRRPVEFGDVHFKLFTGPGFSVSRLVIHEDPAFGREPFAYVESLEARPRLLALLAGKLEFASLRLENPSVNLTRVESGPGAAWNFSELLRRTKFDVLPALQVRSGRINFKFGDIKSVFYVMDADLDVSPPSMAGADWHIEFSGEPARTDRPARGFGSFSAQGSLRPANSLDLDFQLQKSAIDEMMSLVYGRDIGVHGFVSARAHPAGALSDLHINGAMSVEEIHRWDLLPQRGTAWPFEFEGRLNLPAERLEIASHSAVKEAPPLALKFRVADYLSHPHWGVGFNWNRFRVEPLLLLARHLGAPLPEGLKMEGSIDGAIGYSEQGRWQGQIAFQNAAVTIPGSSPVRFEQAAFLFDGSHVRLPLAVVRTATDDQAGLEAEYDMDTGALALSIATDSMPVAGLRSQASLAAVPILDQVQGGVWKGKLLYERLAGSDGRWSGGFQLENADIPLMGLAEPVRVETANARIEGSRLALEKIRATLGDLAAQADYHYEPGVARPHRLRISLAILDAAESERLMTPTLARHRGLIARALTFGRAPVPDWLADRRLEGTISVNALQLGGLGLQKLRARLIWNGTTLALADLKADLAKGAVAGDLTVDLRGSDPV